MTLARTLAYIARFITFDNGNNPLFIGNLGIGSATVTAGNVFQVGGNVNIAGTTTISNVATFNGSTTISGPTVFNSTATLNSAIALTKAKNENKGAAVASASTTNIWSNNDGNLLHVTGTTTITSLGTAPQAGAKRQVIFDGALILTYNASTLVIPGAANITTAAGDMWEFVADTTTKIIGTPISVSKLAPTDGSALTNIPQIGSSNNFTADQTIARGTTPNINLINTTAPGVATAIAGGVITFYGNNASSVTTIFSQLYGYIQSAVAAAENGWIIFQNIYSGAVLWRFAIGQGLFSQNVTGADKGLDSINVKAYYIDGVQQYADTLPWTTYQATSDFSVTSNTTYQNHPQLQIPVTSGVSYELYYDFSFSSTLAGGIKVNFTGPTTSRCVGLNIGILTAGQGIGNITSVNIAIEVGSASSGGTDRGFISFTPSANGTFIVQIAQQTSNATPMTIFKGSWVRIRVV
jgi:hypothetical protein